MNCIDCGKVMIEGTVEYTFPYGIGENPAQLPVSHIGFHCPACGLILSDYRGEDARTAAVANHLASGVHEEHQKRNSN